jgi:O-antigen/teichoic acid export membrane protein
LTQKDLRLQYSGLVLFASRLVSVGTGLFFALILARAASPAEYDVWFNMNDISTYFTLMAGVLPFWALRFVAREKEGAIKTGLFSNFIVSLVATAIFVPLIPVIVSALGPRAEPYILVYFLFSFQIIEFHLLSMFEACFQARTPRIVGYGLLIQQVGKVAIGYIMIVQLHQPLLGAVVATIVSFFTQIIYYSKLLFGEMKQKIKWAYIREWFKGSIANVINVIGNQIAGLVLVWLFAFGGEGARGSYGAAMQVSTVITYSLLLSYALYPKLIAERRTQDITDSLKMVLMFALPMTFGAIALSNAFIVLLRPDYPSAGPVLVALSIDSLIIVLSGIFSVVLYGMETLDQNSQISLRKLARSKLLLVLFLPYFHSMITIPSTLYVLGILAQNQPILAALYVSIINMTARFVMFVVLIIIVRRITRFKVPWVSIGKYIGASVAMVLFLEAFLVVAPQPSIAYVLAATIVGGLIYLGVLMAIDKEARALPRLVLKQLRGTNKQES